MYFLQLLWWIKKIFPSQSYLCIWLCMDGLHENWFICLIIISFPYMFFVHDSQNLLRRAFSYCRSWSKGLEAKLAEFKAWINLHSKRCLMCTYKTFVLYNTHHVLFMFVITLVFVYTPVCWWPHPSHRRDFSNNWHSR